MGVSGSWLLFLGPIIWGIDLPLGIDPIVFGIFGAGLVYMLVRMVR